MRQICAWQKEARQSHYFFELCMKPLKMPIFACLQGSKRKNDPAKFLLQGQFSIVVLILGFSLNQIFQGLNQPLIAA